jgi:hypothetical protein
MVAPRLFPPVSMSDILTEIAQLTDAQAHIIEAEMKAPQAFSSDSNRWDRIAVATEIDRDSVEYLFSFLAFLNTELDRKAGDESVRSQLIDSLLSDAVVEPTDNESPEEVALAIPKLKDRLLQLAAHSEGAAFHRKALRLRKGFLRNAKSFSSFVDLRPVIDKDRQRIEGFVTMVQLQITTDRDEGAQPIVVQLDEEALAKMFEAIVDAQKKLSLLKSSGYSLERISNK